MKQHGKDDEQDNEMMTTRGCILDISIKYRGSSSNCLAFEASELHRQLEDGLMKKHSIHGNSIH
jgi:hypothetical protein